MTTSISDDVRVIEEALAAGPTPGEWRRVAQGGASTVLACTQPRRNDTRIPAYGFNSDNGHCIAYPDIGDNGERDRIDYVHFSHADASYIAATNPARLRRVLDTMQAQAQALKKTAAVCAGETMSKRGLIDALESARAALALYEGSK